MLLACLHVFSTQQVARKWTTYSYLPTQHKPQNPSAKRKKATSEFAEKELQDTLTGKSRELKNKRNLLFSDTDLIALWESKSIQANSFKLASEGDKSIHGFTQTIWSCSLLDLYFLKKISSQEHNRTGNHTWLSDQPTDGTDLS